MVVSLRRSFTIRNILTKLCIYNNKKQNEKESCYAAQQIKRGSVEF